MKPGQLKAIVLTCDPYRAIAEHMMLQYDRLWPEHPFVFWIPYQQTPGSDSERTRYVKTPESIRSRLLHLLGEVDDNEWVYWCIDDKYPIQLRLRAIERCFSDMTKIPGLDGLLFCRCRVTLTDPKRALLPGEIVGPSGTVYLERRAWFQIWIHQLLRVKVLRYLFTQLPEDIPTGKAMDELKDNVPMPANFRLLVTKQNLAVFGESTHRGQITQNCYESAIGAGIALPEWFQQSTGEHIIIGNL